MLANSTFLWSLIPYGNYPPQRTIILEQLEFVITELAILKNCFYSCSDMSAGQRRKGGLRKLVGQDKPDVMATIGQPQPPSIF